MFHTWCKNPTNSPTFQANKRPPFFHLTTAQIKLLIAIQAADYVVKVTGFSNSLSYMQIYVSSCWSNQIFNFRLLAGEQHLEVRLTPNDCVIPGIGRISPYFIYTDNILSSKSGKTKGIISTLTCMESSFVRKFTNLEQNKCKNQ